MLAFFKEAGIQPVLTSNVKAIFKNMKIKPELLNNPSSKPRDLAATLLFNYLAKFQGDIDPIN